MHAYILFDPFVLEAVEFVAIELIGGSTVAFI